MIYNKVIEKIRIASTDEKLNLINIIFMVERVSILTNHYKNNFLFHFDYNLIIIYIYSKYFK